MNLPEKTLQLLEVSIPVLAEAALKQAYWHALASGSAVVLFDGDQLVEQQPDGEQKSLGITIQPDYLPISAATDKIMPARFAPRLRLFAGPEGSGKRTITRAIPREVLGIYVNAVDIEDAINQPGDYLDLRAYGIKTSAEEILDFFQSSAILAEADLLEEAEGLRFSDDKLSFFEVIVNPYFAAVAAAFICSKLLEARISFTFESILTTSAEVALLQQAQAQGYRTYLYYVATESPIINHSRVSYRVKRGGRAVSEDSLATDYQASLAQLSGVLTWVDHACFFDTSSQESVFIAEKTAGCPVEIRRASVPHWFRRAVIDKCNGHLLL